MWRIVAPTPEPIRTRTETNATFEKRGTVTASPATRLPAERLPQTTSRPTSPPSQSEPEARWSQSSSSETPRGAVCPACPEVPGRTSTAAAAASAPPVAASSAIERCSRRGRSTQTAIQAATQNRAKQSSMST